MGDEVSIYTRQNCKPAFWTWRLLPYFRPFVFFDKWDGHAGYA